MDSESPRTFAVQVRISCRIPIIRVLKNSKRLFVGHFGYGTPLGPSPSTTFFHAHDEVNMNITSTSTPTTAGVKSCTDSPASPTKSETLLSPQLHLVFPTWYYSPWFKAALFALASLSLLTNSIIGVGSTIQRACRRRCSTHRRAASRWVSLCWVVRKFCGAVYLGREVRCVVLLSIPSHMYRLISLVIPSASLNSTSSTLSTLGGCKK